MDPRPADDAFPLPATPADAVDAEIADHLATAAAQLQAQGTPPEAAQRAAQEKFGDVASIRRHCYWIDHGETLMFRTAVLVLLVGMSLGLTVAAVGTWRSQSHLAEQVTALTEQIKLLAENQRAAPPPTPPAPSEPKPQEIAGRVYDGSPERPVAGKELIVVNVKDASIVRRVRSDAQGQYRSGPLPDGDYALVAALESKTPPSYLYSQSQPIYVYPGMGPSHFDFDVAYHAGRLRLTTSRPLPRRQVAGKYTIDSRLMVSVTVPRISSDFWTSDQKTPEDWPLYLRNLRFTSGRSGDAVRLPGSSFKFYELLSPSDLEADWSQTRFADAVGLVPVGEVTVQAALLVDVLPAEELPAITIRRGQAGRSGLSRALGGGSRTTESPREQLAIQWQFKDWLPLYSASNIGPRALDQPSWNTEDDDFFWLTKGLGKRWLEHLLRKPDVEVVPEPFLVSSYWLNLGAEATRVPIRDGRTTRVRVEIPDDVEDTLQQFVESVTDPAAFAQRTLGERLRGVIQSSRTLQDRVEEEEQRIRAEIQSGTNPFFRPVTLIVDGTDDGAP
jgi:hypothetical protein